MTTEPRNQIEISLERGNLTTELSQLTSMETKTDETMLRIQEIETRLMALNEEETRLLAGFPLPGTK